MGAAGCLAWLSRFAGLPAAGRLELELLELLLEEEELLYGRAAASRRRPVAGWADRGTRAGIMATPSAATSVWSSGAERRDGRRRRCSDGRPSLGWVSLCNDWRKLPRLTWLECH